MSRAELPHVKIECPNGQAVLTRVTVDGQEFRGVTFVRFEASIPERHAAQVTLRFFADVEIEGEPAIVREWRYARPWWRRLFGMNR